MATEATVSARIPKALEKELEQYMEAEHLERSSAVRKLLYSSIQEWKEAYALKLLEGGKTTFSRAAEIAGLDVWSFSAKIKDAKIQWVKDRAVREDLGAL
ncbi:UPF0175 family protein [Candidatus Woesearchaeota archaeon]|nr:UPF0175 family protein [Candidatus Woesearchaeota archaeon]